LPSERHIIRQIRWREALRKKGAHVSLEKTVHIRSAKVIVDVYAKIEDKTFLIEIGDIEDHRKHSLLQYYSEENPNIIFVHEPYGRDEISRVLEFIDAYRNSREYYLKKRQKLLEKKLCLQRSIRKPLITDKQAKFFLGVLCAIVYFFCLGLPFVPSSSLNKMSFYDSVIFSACVVTFFTLFVGWAWKTRNTFEHPKYDATLRQELADIEQKLADIEKELFTLENH